MGEFYQYIQNNLTYPEDAKAQGIEGKVYVQFVVAKSGKLMDVKAVKGIGGGCDEEAVRVVKESKPWNPGSQRGIKVNVRMIMPITFKLG
jgi:protein TonB